MLWFKHPNNFRTDPKFRAIEKKLGEAGYARAVKLFEIVAERGGKADEFLPEFSLQKITDIDWLSQELGISKRKSEKTLEIFGEVGLIDPQALSEKIVRIPLLEEYLDDWTKRRNRGRTPEQLRSDSGTTTEQLRLKSKRQSKSAEKEAEGKPQRTERATAAASPFQENSEANPKSQEVHSFWKDIGMRPLGTPAFCRAMERFYDECPELPVSGRMEEGIQFCRSGNIPVPPPIFEAKRKIESREFDVGPHLNDEVGRVAGPRGVPEELMR